MENILSGPQLRRIFKGLFIDSQAPKKRSKRDQKNNNWVTILEHVGGICGSNVERKE